MKCKIKSHNVFHLTVLMEFFFGQKMIKSQNIFQFITKRGTKEE